MIMVLRMRLHHLKLYTASEEMSQYLRETLLSRGVNGGGDGGGDASPPSFWPGGSNASHPPLAAVAIGFNDLHL